MPFSAPFAFSSFADTMLSLCFRSLVRESPFPKPGAFVPPVALHPSGLMHGDYRPSQVPELSFCIHATISDPGGVLSACLEADRSAAFRCLHIVGFEAGLPSEPGGGLLLGGELDNVGDAVGDEPATIGGEPAGMIDRLARLQDAKVWQGVLGRLGMAARRQHQRQHQPDLRQKQFFFAAHCRFHLDCISRSAYRSFAMEQAYSPHRHHGRRHELSTLPQHPYRINCASPQFACRGSVSSSKALSLRRIALLKRESFSLLYHRTYSDDSYSAATVFLPPTGLL